mmetsp:Transcript_19863/g.29521  ORF Transcript_19863/g.29521 Transcript_19863/m.29521 type:complete len:100 (-) Transcript_19863:121-420(-)
MVDGVSVLMAKRVWSPDKRSVGSSNPEMENVEEKDAKKEIDGSGGFQNNLFREGKMILSESWSNLASIILPPQEVKTKQFMNNQNQDLKIRKRAVPEQR